MAAHDLAFLNATIFDGTGAPPIGALSQMLARR